MMIRGIIFDLDGTLLNTLEDIAVAENAALQRLGLPARPVDEYRLIVGGGADDIARRLLPNNYQTQEQILAFIENFREHYRQNWHSLTKPYNGVIGLLEDLEKLQIKLAVLSNKPQEFVDRIAAFYFHDHHDLKRPVPFTHIYGQRPGHPVKPDPAVALEIAEAWKFGPDQIGLVGDSDIDILTAQNAGMLSFGACWGFRGSEELEATGADILLRTPMDLLNYLN